MAQNATLQEKPKTEPDVKVSEMPNYKEDINAFSESAAVGKDFISKLPSETLDHILSYCILDHDPERAVKMQADYMDYKEQPHVLLSLAAMSSHFHAHVEDFSRRHLITHKDTYRFKTNAEQNQQKKSRRSTRLKSKGIELQRCYRMEMMKHLQWHCIHCNSFCSTPAIMANGVRCCKRCEAAAFPGQIVSSYLYRDPRYVILTCLQDLTTALKRYDLRDWMLIKTRKPGPRAKKTDLPAINYGTVRTGTPLFLGMVVSYRFFENDVEAIAKLVHGDVEKHMSKKRKERREHKKKKRVETIRELKIQDFTGILATVTDKDEKAYFQNRK